MLHEFSYVAPTAKAELFALLEKHGAKARILAGGTDLLVDVRAGVEKPDVVIDVKKIPEFHGITFSAKDGLAIGATTTACELTVNPIITGKYPLLADAAGRIGSPQLRNRATIGGNICTASPCADLGNALLALGARVEIGSVRGTRVVPLKKFFTWVKETQLAADEVVQRFLVDAELAGARYGMEKLKRIKGHDMALASVSMIKKGNLLRVAIGSCAPTPVVLPDLPATATVQTVIAAALKVIKPIDDIRASKEYRTFMVQASIEKLHAALK